MPEEKPSFFQRWSSVHRKRKAAHKEFMNEYYDRSADLSRLGHTADYAHKEAFFEANTERRGDDVAVGNIDDASLRWSIGWIPATGEVIGTAANWIDAEETEKVPDYVFILGNAASEQAARNAVVRSHTLETLKDALYG